MGAGGSGWRGEGGRWGERGATKYEERVDVETKRPAAWEKATVFKKPQLNVQEIATPPKPYIAKSNSLSYRFVHWHSQLGMFGGYNTRARPQHI